MAIFTVSILSNQRDALSRARNEDRECGRRICGRPAGPFLPWLDRRSRVERAGLRSAEQSGLIGEVQWCTTVTLQKQQQIEAAPPGQPWSGEASLNPFNIWGKQDPFGDWAGWVYAVDADTGQWRWRAKTNYPIQSGMTPTAGGVVFFGDMGGNFYALDVNDGHKLWGQKIGGAVGGGVITYMAGQSQRVAAATGLTEILWPTEITTAKVSILGLDKVP